MNVPLAREAIRHLPRERVFVGGRCRCGSRTEKEAPPTCQERVEELSVRLLPEPPERRVGYPLHDALVEDAPHLLLVPALELADKHRILAHILGLGGAQGRAGRRAAPHDRVFFGPAGYSVVLVRNDFSLANHFGRRKMHATGREGQGGRTDELRAEEEERRKG